MKSRLCLLGVFMLALTAIFAFTQNAFANGAAKVETEERVLSGIILKLDRNARTMTIEETRTKKITTYRVPPKQNIYIRSFSIGHSRSVPFERVMRGMSVNMRITIEKESAEENNLAKVK
jgi:hypothetical protein